MELVAVVTALALMEYLYIAARVAIARNTYDIEAPSVTGNESFERIFRVQMNTVEQLVVFLPGMWLFARFASEAGAAVLGLVFIAGRALYLRSYVADPATRGPGFLIGYVATGLLLLGGFGGAVLELY